jgi:hypothetical protein
MSENAKTAILAGGWLAAGIAAFGVGAIGDASSAPARQPCRAPRLTGLTFEKASVRARRAGCQLHRTGAALKLGSVQTVARQSPAAGHRAAGVTVWTNPLCFGSAAYPPAIKEPLVTAGPTEFVSGFFLVGGPLVRFSTRHCARPAPVPEAGTVEVKDASAVVAMKASAPGHLVRIPLPPGTYTISGRFKDASFNAVHPGRTERVTITPGYKVRQDCFLDVP